MNSLCFGQNAYHLSPTTVIVKQRKNIPNHQSHRGWITIWDSYWPWGRKKKLITGCRRGRPLWASLLGKAELTTRPTSNWCESSKLWRIIQVTGSDLQLYEVSGGLSENRGYFLSILSLCNRTAKGGVGPFSALSACRSALGVFSSEPLAQPLIHLLKPGRVAGLSPQ